MKIFESEVDQIREYAQEWGMTDNQIAQMLGCSRATVNRARQKNDIPIRNVNNKADKTYTCINCKEEIVIRRSDTKKLLCDFCLKDLKNNL